VIQRVVKTLARCLAQPPPGGAVDPEHRLDLLRALSPPEFMHRLAALVPRPRLHLIRCRGVLAPHAKLRARLVPQGPAARGRAADAAGEIRSEAQPVQARAHRIGWARLLKRVSDIDLRRCPSCGGGELEIIAAILQRAAIEKILTHLGLDPRPPPRGRVSEAGHAGHAFAAG